MALSLKNLKAMKNDKITTILPNPKKTLNIVVVGDGDTGKTSLLMAFKGKKLDATYTPTVFETYTDEITVDGQTIELGLWDTAGQEGYDRLRPLAYPNCDAFIICYSVNSPESLHNVTAKWLPEIEHFCPGVPKILTATKKDLRRRTLAIMDILNGNEAAKFVSFEEGMCTAARVGATKFIETSALYNDSIRELFQHTARAALYEKTMRRRAEKKEGQKEREGMCSIL